MASFRYLLMVAIPLAVTFGLWSALCAWPETSAQEQTANVEVVTGCIDCARKIEIPQDAAEFAALKAAVVQRQAERDAAAAEQNRLRATRWRGCRFTLTAESENADEHDRQKMVAATLFQEQKIPDCRVEAFRWATSRLDVILVGWTATVKRVVEVNGGKRVELEVAPELTTKAGGIAFTPYRSKETWFIDQGGSVTLEKSEPVAGTAKLILSL